MYAFYSKLLPDYMTSVVRVGHQGPISKLQRTSPRWGSRVPVMDISSIMPGMMMGAEHLNGPHAGFRFSIAYPRCTMDSNKATRECDLLKGNTLIHSHFSVIHGANKTEACRLLTNFFVLESLLDSNIFYFLSTS